MQRKKWFFFHFRDASYIRLKVRGSENRAKCKINCDLFVWHVIPTSENLALNLGQGFAYPAKVQIGSQGRFCHPCKSLNQIQNTISRGRIFMPWFLARFCHPCKSPNGISGILLQPLQNSKPISGHTSATPATFCPRFLAHNSIFHLPSARFWGNHFAFLLFCWMAVLTDGN